MPKEIDSKGTAFRIRPQTPRLNLLKNRPNKVGRDQRKPEPLERKVTNNLLAPLDHTLFKPKPEIKKKKKKPKVQEQQRESVEPVTAAYYDSVEVRDDLSEDTPKHFAKEDEAALERD